MSLHIKRAGSSATDPAAAVAEVFAGVHQPDAALTIFYCSSRYDLPALAASGGNRRRAAAQLGIGLRTLYDKLKRYGLST